MAYPSLVAFDFVISQVGISNDDPIRCSLGQNRVWLVFGILDVLFNEGETEDFFLFVSWSTTRGSDCANSYVKQRVVLLERARLFRLCFLLIGWTINR